MRWLNDELKACWYHFYDICILQPCCLYQGWIWHSDSIIVIVTNTPADLEYRAFISHDFNVFKFRQNGNITRLTIWLFVYFFLNAWYSNTLNSFEQYIFPLSSAAGHRSYYHRNKNEVDMLLFIVVITNIKI